ncbi:MAG: hypothetical protein OEY43_02450 [Gammaproteobacteria bacterium]|nr:hypothetical protein [Gammaproteobacteria bacterium]
MYRAISQRQGIGSYILIRQMSKAVKIRSFQFWLLLCLAWTPLQLSAAQAVELIKLYSDGQLAAQWQAIAPGRIDSNCYLFKTSQAADSDEMRICGVYSVEKLAVDSIAPVEEHKNNFTNHPVLAPVGEGWLPSYRGQHFKLGGELELEYVDTENGIDIDNPYGHFQVDKFTLLPRAQLTDRIALEALLLFKPDKTTLSEVYVIFSELPLESELTIGLDDRFINEWPARRTESFALIDTAFARDDTLGMVWERKKGKVFWHVSLTNGFELNESGPSEDKSFKFIHDNRQSTDTNSNKVVGLGLGRKIDIAEKTTLSVMGFGYWGSLSSDDIDFLQDVAGYGNSADDNQLRYGLALDLKHQSFNLGAKAIRARDGELDRDGWYLQTGYTFKLPENHYAQSIEPFIRYGVLNVDLPHVLTDSLSWDRSMTTLALLTSIRKNIKLKTEYYLNGESTGDVEVDNNEFLMQLEVKF